MKKFKYILLHHNLNHLYTRPTADPNSSLRGTALDVEYQTPFSRETP